MKRNLSLDILRIVCAIFVVFIHVSPAYSQKNDGFLPLILNPLFRVALPLFFMISGYLILNSKINSLSEFYKKRLKTIIIPFILFSFIHYSFFHQWDSDQFSFDWLKNYALSLVSGYPVNTGRDYFMTALYWFVYTIIGLYLITPLVAKCISFINEKNAITSLCILLVLFAFQQFAPHAFSSLGMSSDWFRSQKFNEFLVYFVLGGIIARTATINIMIPVFVSLISFATVVYQQHVAVEGNWFGKAWIDANVFMMTLCCCILIIVHTKKIEFESNAITYISSLTYGVYLIQIVTISLADRYTRTFKPEYFTYTILTGIGAIFMAFIISAIVQPILKKI